MVHIDEKYFPLSYYFMVIQDFIYKNMLDLICIMY